MEQDGTQNPDQIEDNRRPDNKDNDNNNKEPTERYILSFYVPTESTKKVCTAVCQSSGAGTYPGGLYQEAYWTTRGTGQFRAMPGSKPAIGEAPTGQSSKVEIVEEDKVEMLCLGIECVRRAILALQKAHPYEEVPYYVLLSESVF